MGETGGGSGSAGGWRLSEKNPVHIVAEVAAVAVVVAVAVVAAVAVAAAIRFSSSQPHDL